ncbi:MAG: O-antigen ligase family protein [Bacteroidota bacterium]
MPTLNPTAYNWWNKEFVFKQLNSPLGYAIIAAIAVLTAGATTIAGLKGSIALLGLVIGTPVLIGCFLNLEFGLLLTVTLSFFVNYLRKLSSFPFGTALDGLLLVMALGLIYRVLKERNFGFANSTMSFIILIWVGYNLLQGLNPNMPSLAGWVYSVRSLAIWLLIYFVGCYAFKSKAAVLRFVVLTIVLTMVAVAVGLRQEFIGFTSKELAWLYADPLRFRLYFTWSRLRIFSLFSDPTSLGIAMAYMSVFCIILATVKFALWKRIGLLVCAALMALTIMYTGSRTPVLMIPAGIFLFVLMTFQKEVIIGAAIFGVVGAGLMFKSTSNPVLFRIQSAFNPTEDSSMQLRLKNQNFIQPYIQENPIGLGLGSIGVWGRRFNPDSWLATFAPDSAYVRIAVEAGWVGLIIYLALFFIAMRTAVYHYYRVRDPIIKVLYLGFANIIFLLIIANYPQEATYMLPTNLVFNCILAIIVRLKDFDEVVEA